MDKLKEIIKYLEDNLYVLVRNKTEYVFSKKFYEDLAKAPSSELAVVYRAPDPALPKWPTMFMKFIMDAKVPKRIQNGGSVFDANKYSEPAMKEFRKIIEQEKVDYNMLVRSTLLYYASNVDYKKKIGNYILDGDWRTDYVALTEAAQGGVEKLEKHIKEERNGNDHNPWS